MPETSLDRLNRVIMSRKGDNPDTSYTAKLFARGPHGCGKKVGEEAVELALAAVDPNQGDVAAECADLFYHVLVLLAACEVPLSEVYAKLDARAGTSGLAEKAGRTPRT